MTYPRNMVRIVAFAIPALAIAGLVFLLNSLEASPGVAVGAYALIAVSSGVTIGYFADRLLEGHSERRSSSPPRLRRDH